MPRKRGLVLLVVIGILGVMTVLATAFVTLARLERRASQQRLETVRAFLLARSGLEDALARISSGQDPLTLPSGGMGRFGPAGAYVLKIEDESGKIDVNGGFLDTGNRDGDTFPDHRDTNVTNPATGASWGWNRSLAQILTRLGTRLGIPALGNRLIANRPLGGYRSIRQVQAACTSSTDLSPYLCLDAWTDRKVIRPQARATNFLAESDLKKNGPPLRLEEGGRPPVNLNTAPRQVLAVLLEGLQGGIHYNMVPNPGYPPVPYTVTAPQADAIADAILRARDAAPFDTWPRFEAFLDSLVPAVLNGNFVNGVTIPPAGDLGLSDLLKAGLNPNTMLTKQMPDQISWRWIDKSDLVAWSTEGSLGPTGCFRLRSLGRVTDLEGRLLASTSVSCTVKAFDLLRQTTQRDFVGEGPRRTPDAGDTSYLSLASRFPRPPLPPQKTSGASASWNTWEMGRGLAAMTYPCPMPAVNAGNAADFDGCVGLATVEFPLQNPPFAGARIRFLQHFDDGWNADYAAPLEDPTLRNGPAGTGGSLQTDPGISVWPLPPAEPSTLHPDGAFLQLGRSPSYAASNLPLDTDATSDHGALLYWVKRAHWTNNVAPDTDFLCVKEQMRLNRSGQLVRGTQILAIGTSTWATLFGAGLLVQSWGEPVPSRFSNNPDVGHERGWMDAYRRFAGVVPLSNALTNVPYAPDLRWHLLEAFYDDDETLPGHDAFLRTRGAADLGISIPYQAFPFDASTGEKLVTDPAMVFTLGGGGSVGTANGYVPHLVMDEFAIYDFGDNASIAQPDSATWALTRFQDGRYYKGDDATFLSTVLSPCSGRPCRLLKASWTERLPSHPRPETRCTGKDETVQPITPRILDPRLANVRLEMDLLDGSGTLRTDPPLRALDRPSGTPVDLSLSSFRYRVCFRTSPLLDPVTGVPDDANQPVLETPFLDDVTFAWQPAEGPRIFDWTRE